LTVEKRCLLAEVSRVGFYRNLQAETPEAEEILFRDRLQDLV